MTWVFEAVSTRWFLQLGGTQEAVPGSPNGSLVSAGGVSVQDVKKVEQMDWAELRTTPTANYCIACGLVAKAVMKEAVRKKGHQKLMCQSYSNVTNMLYKRVSMADLGFRDLENIAGSIVCAVLQLKFM